MLSPRTLIELGFYWDSRILHTAVSLGVFTALDTGPKTSEEISSMLGTDRRATGLLLNALVSLNLLRKSGARYANTKLSSRFLVEGKDGYIGYIIKHVSNMWKTWEKLEASVKSGKPVETSGAYQPAKDELHSFILGMHNIASFCAPMLAKKLKLTGCKNLLDLGGGPGTYSIYFCKANPGLKASIFDFSDVLNIAREVIAGHGMRERIKLMPGDYDEDEIPGGFDAALLSNIIHSEGEDENARLIKKVYERLNNKGKIIINDFILNEDKTKPAWSAMFALNMLVNTDKGRSYSFGEIEKWLKDAGFNNIKRPEINLPNSGRIITGEKIA
jgi:ubiquinone/menaquinone biosynthesis C-methylase UbiE